MTVLDVEGLSHSVTRQVSVTPPNQPPTAVFTYTQAGLTINVDGRNSTDDRGISSYSWNWGDNTAVSTRSFDSHTYANAGTFTVNLTVTDTNGLSNSTSQSVTVTVPNAAPVARFSSTSNGLTLNVNAGASTDDKLVVLYRWSWGDGHT